MRLPDNFWIGATGSLIFGFVGIFLLLFGFKLFDWLLPKVDFQQELKSNPIAIAIVIGAFFLSLSHIIASCVN
jgi:uncharacterized membrane protein YjfL (UPF0719 family)